MPSRCIQSSSGCQLSAGSGDKWVGKVFHEANSESILVIIALSEARS